MEVRRTEPHEYRRAADAMATALMFSPPSDEEWGQSLSSWEHDHLSVSAWDGDQCVGNVGAFHFDTVAPGGARLATAGVTRVGVLPTHTRQGALTRMMHRLLELERSEGRPLASLRASEAVIYRRYGFGVAGDAASVKLEARRMRPIGGVGAGSFRILRPDDIVATVQPLYDGFPHRAGAVSRSASMWKRYLANAVDAKKGNFVVVHSNSDGIDNGYVHYSLQWTDHHFHENLGLAKVFDLFAATPAAELALWDYVASISLVRTIEAECRPVDDLIRHAIHDRRGYELSHRWDEQWLRLLDVETALRARTYGIGDPITLLVTDPLFNDNTDTFSISNAGVERVSGPADLAVPIDALSAAYMGSAEWTTLLAAGRLSAGTIDAATRADALFSVSPGTWSGSMF